MEAIRRYVFPPLWLLIFLIIAAALVKMAFFSSPSSANPGAEDFPPDVSIDMYATVPVERGAIASELSLSGTVESDAGAPQKVQREGEINWIGVKNGDRVAKGDKILETRVPKEPEAPQPAPEDGNDPDAPAAPAPPQKPQYRYHALFATADGVIRDLNAMVGQTVAVGDVVANISPGTYTIVAALTPEQQLDLMDGEIKATAKVPTSAEPITCKSPAIKENDDKTVTAPGTQAPDPQSPDDAALDESGAMPDDGDGSGGTSMASLRCPVPAEVKVVPGLSVTVTVDLGSRTDVLTVPATAATGSKADGAVWVLDDATGAPVEKQVELGLSGQGRVEIVSGLEEGDEVLEYVPGVDNPDEMYPEDMEVW